MTLAVLLSCSKGFLITPAHVVTGEGFVTNHIHKKHNSCLLKKRFMNELRFVWSASDGVAYSCVQCFATRTRFSEKQWTHTTIIVFEATQHCILWHVVHLPVGECVGAAVCASWSRGVEAFMTTTSTHPPFSQSFREEMLRSKTRWNLTENGQDNQNSTCSHILKYTLTKCDSFILGEGVLDVSAQLAHQLASVK